MPNYVPKEKKPVLTRDAIKKDLKVKYKTPPLFRFSLFFMISLMIPVCIALIVYTVSLFFVENGWLFGIYYSIGTLVYMAVTVFLVSTLAMRVVIPTVINLNKFDIQYDTVRLKVASEKKLDISFRGPASNREKYRYPSVLYFNKYGRYEVCFNTRGNFGEQDSRIENRSARLLDSYELEKEYIVAFFGKKKPRALIVYDPDEYDVQL